MNPLNIKSSLLKYRRDDAYSLEGHTGFNAWVHPDGVVEASRHSHDDMYGEEDSREKGLRDGLVRAVVAHKFDDEKGEPHIGVMFRHDDVKAQQHALEFVRNQHRGGLPIHMDRVGKNGWSSHDSATFNHPDEMADYLQKHPSGRRVTDMARARMLPYGDEGVADALIGQRLREMFR